jgi:hypothetical protein
MVYSNALWLSDNDSDATNGLTQAHDAVTLKNDPINEAAASSSSLNGDVVVLEVQMDVELPEKPDFDFLQKIYEADAHEMLVPLLKNGSLVVLPIDAFEYYKKVVTDNMTMLNGLAALHDAVVPIVGHSAEMQIIKKFFVENKDVFGGGDIGVADVLQLAPSVPKIIKAFKGLMTKIDVSAFQNIEMKPFLDILENNHHPLARLLYSFDLGGEFGDVSRKLLPEHVKTALDNAIETAI